MFMSATPAWAQIDVWGEARISTDERRRGLSWSDGDIAPSAQIGVAKDALELSVRVASARKSERHGGADTASDIELGYRLIDSGGLSLRAMGVGHVFTGARGAMSFGEVGGDLSYMIGPAQLTAGARYAPDQAAIGGNNLYLFGEASAGIPTTPFTLRAGIGRSSGSTDDPLRAARLRPQDGGAYTDWWLGVSHVTGPLTIGVTYSDTDIDRARVTALLGDARHTSGKLAGRIGVSF